MEMRGSSVRALHDLEIQLDCESEDDDNSEEAHSFTAAAVMNIFGLSARVQHAIPSRIERGGKYGSFTLMQQDALNRVLNRVIRGAAQLLVPNDADAFENACRCGRVEEGKLRKNLVASIRAAKKGSVERRVLCGCLCVTTTASDTRILLANDAADNITGSAEDVNSGGSEDGGGEAADLTRLCNGDNIVRSTATGSRNMRQRTCDDSYVSTAAPECRVSVADGAMEEPLSYGDRVSGYLQRTFRRA